MMNRYTKRLEALEQLLMERKRAERMKELESKRIGTNQSGRFCGVPYQYAEQRKLGGQGNGQGNRDKSQQY